jgi:hypothetical protein
MIPTPTRMAMPITIQVVSMCWQKAQHFHERGEDAGDQDGEADKYIPAHFMTYLLARPSVINAQSKASSHYSRTGRCS